MPQFQPTGMYLEDYVPGAGKLSPGRTVTSADIDMFAEWIGDPSFARQHAADGRRLVGAPLLVNLADALFQRLGCVEGTGYCNLGWTWKFMRPFHEWDTLWVRTRWNSTRPSRSIAGVGIVNMTLTLLNQHDEEIAIADWTLMVLSRNASGQPQVA
ncbi:MAG: acyl dehydratase [Alphaproteobacteria bacterium]|nr:MAG: acyl dehydratase [Alphaproteobacteria bacterium]